MSESLDLQPQLPRHCKRPQRYEEGLAQSEFHDNAKTSFKQHYFESINLAFNCIKDGSNNQGTKSIATAHKSSNG